MKCNQCGMKLRIVSEQVGTDTMNKMIYQKFGYCDKCMIKYNLKENPQNMKEHSVLSIIGLILAIIGLFTICIFLGLIPCIVSIILCIIPLFQKGKKKVLSIIGLVCNMIAIFILGILFIAGLLLVSDSDIPESDFRGSCSEIGCANEREPNDDYCVIHRDVDIEKKLTNRTVNITKNSAGGIVLDFSAKNATGKEIKYVRFDAYLFNAVGDMVEDDIHGKPMLNVEIVGPVEAEKMVSVHEEIIGYCDECTRIYISEIKIIYMDGTSEKGTVEYYFKSE